VIEKARKQLLIYNDNVSDKLMLRLLRERADAGVEIRVIGKLAKNIPGVSARKLSDMRLHVRALISDGTTAFVGSQGLRKPEMDERREIGLVVKDARIAKKMHAVFEADWALTKGPKTQADDEDDSDLTGEAAAG
jgi:phosphatidylserine/phosphatidylglycerophosphate/cardiolipin synthase-like enzyme